MIEIKVDKESEIVWLNNVLSAGVLNSNQTYTMNFLGVPLRQDIHYIKSDDYEDDIKEKREEYHNRFDDTGLRLMDIEEILRKEYKQTK